MVETYVRLLCPECNKDWESSPNDLPVPDKMFHCPDCHATYHMAEFTRTDRDLQTLKQLQ